MAYNEFTFPQLQDRFGIVVENEPDLFEGVTPREASPLLLQYLAKSVPVAVNIGTEKARSEMIITPILLEILDILHNKVSLFSGVDFSVDVARGLRGVCDYLFSRSPQRSFITAPVIAIVEAKNDNVKSGLAQCAAEMVAAQAFNQERAAPLETIYGVVTNGSIWKFMRLTGTTVSLDDREYFFSELDKILGVLLSMLNVDDPSRPASVANAPLLPQTP